jgi:hypothetical protein
LMDIKGSKILKNIKTYWISMLNPTKWKFVEYKILLTRMVRDTHMKFLKHKLTLIVMWCVHFAQSCMMNALIKINASTHQFFAKDGHLFMWIHWGHQSLPKPFLHTSSWPIESISSDMFWKMQDIEVG